MKKINKVISSSLLLAALMFLQSCNANSTNKKSDTPQGDDEFVNMLDENSLKGWEGDTTIWSIQNSILVGEIKADGEPLKNNTFLIWTESEPGDFVMRAKFKISENGNSGINYRSVRYTELPFALKGYQADIDGQKNYTGQNYEERNRTTLAYRGERTVINEVAEGVEAVSKGNAWTNRSVLDTIDNLDNLKNIIKSEDWNDIEIVAQGNKLSHYVNGQLMCEVEDNDSKNRVNNGFIGLQVHVGPPMKVEYKDMQIKKLN